MQHACIGAYVEGMHLLYVLLLLFWYILVVRVTVMLCFNRRRDVVDCVLDASRDLFRPYSDDFDGVRFVFSF